MQFLWFRSSSLRVLKFVQIKERGFNFCGEPIFQNVWIIWFPLLYLSLKTPMDQNSSSFIRFQFILHESGRLFSGSWNFCKLKRGDLISRGTNFAECLNYLVPLWCFNLKSFMDPNSPSFIAFQCILHDSGVLFWGFSNLYKLKRGDLVSAGNQFCRMPELFGPPFHISLLKDF